MGNQLDKLAIAECFVLSLTKFTLDHDALAI